MIRGEDIDRQALANEPVTNAICVGPFHLTADKYPASGEAVGEKTEEGPQVPVDLLAVDWGPVDCRKRLRHG